MKIFFNYFLRGLLFIFPVGATLMIIVFTIRWFNNLIAPTFDKLLGFHIPGLGLISMVILIVLVGVVVGYFGKPLSIVADLTLSKTPFIKIIYTGIKDFTEAIIGEKKKFNKPVMVQMSDTGIMKIGFITQENTDDLGIDGFVAVYFPHSYNFSGNLFLVPGDKIIKIDANTSGVLKYIVSGGVMSLSETKEQE